MNTVIAMITVIIKVTTVTILLPPWNVTKGREKGSDVKLYLLQPHCSGSAHCTRMRLHFTYLSRIFRRKRFTGCWLPRAPWDLDFLLPFLRVPCRSCKLALDLDMLLNHVFLLFLFSPCALNIFTENDQKLCDTNLPYIIRCIAVDSQHFLSCHPILESRRVTHCCSWCWDKPDWRVPSSSCDYLWMKQ